MSGRRPLFKRFTPRPVWPDTVTGEERAYWFWGDRRREMSECPSKEREGPCVMARAGGYFDPYTGEHDSWEMPWPPRCRWCGRFMSWSELEEKVSEE